MEIAQHSVLFVGDSPNDETMFGYFTYSVGVANIQESLACEFQRPTLLLNIRAEKGSQKLLTIFFKPKPPLIVKRL
jgi:hypothetical protein